MSLTLPEKVLRRFPNEVFIETGTYNGGGVALAIKCGFERIWSIEVDPDKAARAKETFSCFDHVNICLGDTLTLLPDILSSLRHRQATIFLDAHPIDKGKLGPVACPLVQELEMLAKARRRDHTLLIDDRWMFEGHFKTNDKEIEYLLRQINPGYRIWHEDNLQRKEDIVVAMI
jgi:predicted O-methyltransferase YrrM